MDDLIRTWQHVDSPRMGPRRRGTASPWRGLPAAAPWVRWILGWFLAAPFIVAAAEPGAQSLALTVGLVRNVFSSVNANDAEAAFKVFCTSVGRRRGYRLDSRVKVFESDAAFRDAILSGSLDLVLIDTWRFVHMPGIGRVAPPLFTTYQRGAVAKRYLLLTRRQGDLERLEDLRGREILVIDVPQSDIGRPWLETLLATSGLGTAAEFFSQVRVVSKPSAAVLPVFFGQNVACVVDEVGFDVMKELNPKVGSGLRAIGRSEPLGHGLILIREKGWPEERQRRDLVEALRDLDADPAGLQLLTLFKTERLVPFEETHLDGVRSLREEQDRARSQRGGNGR